MIPLPIVEGVEFRYVANYPDYCVGDDGSVWSSKRGSWIRLTPSSVEHDTYPHIIFSTEMGDVCFDVHVLVLEAFEGSRPEGYVARHADRDPTNCCRTNLSWGTYVENEADKLAHGTTARGENHGMRKLTEDDVREIRSLCGTISDAEIGRRFGISGANVGYIKMRRTWNHVR